MSENFKGNENSPYWNKLERYSLLEEKTANPDLLSELNTLFPLTVVTSQQEEQYNLYLKAIEKVKFSKQQKIIWDLFSLKYYTVTKIAQDLGLSKSTISKTLKVAIEKLKIECEKERVKQFSNNRDVAGFQKGITTKGHADTDQMIKERLEQHQSEIEAFYKEHPELKEGRKTKDDSEKE